MKAVDPIFRLLATGGVALLQAGRSPRDLDVDDDRIRPLVEGLRRRMREELGMVLLIQSKATGLVWDTSDLRNTGMRNLVENGLRAHELLDLGAARGAGWACQPKGRPPPRDPDHQPGRLARRRHMPHLLLRRSHASRQPVSPLELITVRGEDVAAVSEGMLTPMDDGPPALYGQTVNHAWSFLAKVAEGLRQGDPTTPHNIRLAGAPATGKTELARRLAAEAGVNCYRINSPKAGIVGETERHADLLFGILNEWAPNVGFCDEVTELLTTERPEHDLDAGASRAVIGALLAYQGNESRRGRTVFLGASNCPWA